MDRMPQAVAEELKNALRRGTVDREATKAAIRYLGQPMGRFAAKRLKAVYAEWTQQHDDATLLDAVGSLAADFGKQAPDTEPRAATPRREDLELICFEYVS
jgi:hypothetical protein